ncbi:hypothetical protein PG996_000197 [Apiospora saccharicola]|uniref:Uncharacterized protein n=1 Tax=Apiospora saccharicola TaxID=335842 RepID=A0ABR1WD40_9PEZI
MYTDREGFRFYRRRRPCGDQEQEQQWEDCEEDGGVSQGFLLVDGDDEDVVTVTVHDVAGHEHFRTLHLGESYEDTRLLSMPEDAQPGDESRYRFQGATVGWWAWGTRQTTSTRPRRSGFPLGLRGQS